MKQREKKRVIRKQPTQTCNQQFGEAQNTSKRNTLMDVKTNTVCYYRECCLQALGFPALPVISRARLSYALLAKSGPSHNETFAQSISCNMYKAPHEKRGFTFFPRFLYPLTHYTGCCSVTQDIVLVI